MDNSLIKEFKYLFKKYKPNSDLINLYLVSMGIRSACLIYYTNIYEEISKFANLEIHYGIYPGFTKYKHDYPLVCLKNSWVSELLPNRELTEKEMGIFLGFNCYKQNWKNVHVNRYEISYILNDNLQIFTEICSKKPDLNLITRIKLKAKQINDAMQLINKNYKVKHKIIFHKPF